MNIHERFVRLSYDESMEDCFLHGEKKIKDNWDILFHSSDVFLTISHNLHFVSHSSEKKSQNSEI